MWRKSETGHDPDGLLARALDRQKAPLARGLLSVTAVLQYDQRRCRLM